MGIPPPIYILKFLFYDGGSNHNNLRTKSIIKGLFSTNFLNKFVAVGEDHLKFFILFLLFDTEFLMP